MKKVLLAATAGLCVIGASMASVRNNVTHVSYTQNLADTTPKDSPKLAVGYLNHVLADTTPKDSPKLAVRYVSRVLADTTPKDSPKLAVAYVR